MLSSTLDPVEAELRTQGKRESRKRKRTNDGRPNPAASQAAIESETARCAQTSLQLDVDLLMLEYLLHQAIGAQFNVLKPENTGATSAAGKTQAGDVLEEKAQTLLQSFQGVYIFHKLLS